jgi:hypothetical protein
LVASLAPAVERFELGPDELRMNSAAEAAIRAGNDVLAPRDPGEIEDAVGDDLGMRRGVGDVDLDRRDRDGGLDIALVRVGRTAIPRFGTEAVARLASRSCEPGSGA